MKLLYLFVVCSLSSVTSYPVLLDKSRGKEESWDHYIFMQQYPAGVCLSHALGFDRKCDYPANTSSWTIHGLWPTLGDTKGPNNCNQSVVFNIDEIQDLVPRLRIEWTNLLTETKYDSFWDHEWCKHGTCSGMPDEHTYFKTILDYFENGMQFGRLLRNQGIVPSEDQQYSLSDFLNAFKEELGAYPYSISCKGSKTTLTQVGVCLDKETMKVTDCPSETNTYGCDRDSIYYPNSTYSLRNY